MGKRLKFKKKHLNSGKLHIKKEDISILKATAHYIVNDKYYNFSKEQKEDMKSIAILEVIENLAQGKLEKITRESVYYLMKEKISKEAKKIRNSREILKWNVFKMGNLINISNREPLKTLKKDTVATLLNGLNLKSQKHPENLEYKIIATLKYMGFEFEKELDQIKPELYNDVGNYIAKLIWDLGESND